MHVYIFAGRFGPVVADGGLAEVKTPGTMRVIVLCLLALCLLVSAQVQVIDDLHEHVAVQSAAMIKAAVAAHEAEIAVDAKEAQMDKVEAVFDAKEAKVEALQDKMEDAKPAVAAAILPQLQAATKEMASTGKIFAKAKLEFQAAAAKEARAEAKAKRTKVAAQKAHALFVSAVQQPDRASIKQQLKSLKAASRAAAAKHAQAAKSLKKVQAAKAAKAAKAEAAVYDLLTHLVLQMRCPCSFANVLRVPFSSTGWRMSTRN